MLHEIAQLFAPWQSLFSDSKVASTSVTTVHIVSLLLGGGLAIAADRSTLRAARSRSEERGRQLMELHAVHRPVLAMLVVLFASGMALMLADVETFAKSPVFWAKMALVVLLVVNGALMTHTEGRLLRADPAAADTGARLWRRLRFNALCSLALWVTTAVAGTVLVNAA